MMKNTKISILLFLTIFLMNSLSAQMKGFSIGAFVEGGKPTGEFANTHDKGIGAGATADIKLPGNLGLTGSVGYMRFGGKIIQKEDGTEKMPTITAMPIRAGLKYRFPLIYTKLEGGVANFSNEEKTAIIVSPGIGFRLMGLDIQVKHETWVNDKAKGFWGVRAGYNF
jgi:hypothetical protein